jgi:hypothetical protein
MGVVYLARDPRLDRMVAIKTLPLGRASDAATRDRFLREARTVARLAHANIVPVYRADEIDGYVFFVMGFVDGDSLAGRLAASPLSPRDAVPILRDVVSALGYAHRHGVVHRDVKTENILLDTTTGRAMVTDFGISRVAESAPTTATGQILGTVYYLSPEQITGHAVDARSDIYALGVVAYAMLAGRFPFDGPLASAVLVAHVNSQAPPLSSIAPHVPASLASIVDRCLAKNPSHRFQTCAELDAALAAAQAEAEQVSIAAPASRSPLVSDTEAQSIFKRAAELQEMTGAQRPAVPPVRRDAERDARRTSGFKTTDLRAAAEEAGIGDAHMQRALAERGLRPSAPDRAEAQPAGDVSVRGRLERFFTPPPTDLAVEMVVNGDIPPHEMDVVAEVVHRWATPLGLKGTAATVGRTFTWTHRALHASSRDVEITVASRNGRTTIRVAESLSQLARLTYFFSLGVGGVISFAIFGNGDVGAGVAIGAVLLTAGYALAGGIVRDIGSDRKERLEELAKEIAAQVRPSESPDRNGPAGSGSR